MIYIFAPNNSITGGAELLHQLCDCFNNNGANSSIIYYPESSNHPAFKYYSNYNIQLYEGNISTIDKSENIIIVPEIATYLLRKFSNSRKSIFWMSIDNYFLNKDLTFYLNIKNKIRNILNFKKLQFSEMRNIIHISQSHYSTIFLKSKNLESFYIGDYINIPINDLTNQIVKKNIIVYNPKKGLKYLTEFMAKYPHYEYRPIQNMTSKEVAQLLQFSKIYMDFGIHPGKDRIPREAVLSGCCILTSNLGSAANNIDIPILSKYKFKRNKSTMFLVNQMIIEIFENFENEWEHFISYRNSIVNSKKDFEINVINFINKFVK
jgi:hypothetical protein